MCTLHMWVLLDHVAQPKVLAGACIVQHSPGNIIFLVDAPMPHESLFFSDVLPYSFDYFSASQSGWANMHRPREIYAPFPTILR